MAFARWPVLLLPVAVACADVVTPTEGTPPSLAKPTAGVALMDLGTLGGDRSSAMGLNSPTAGKRLLIVGRSQESSGAYRPTYWYVDPVTRAKVIAPLSLSSAFGSGVGFDANAAEQIAGFASVNGGPSGSTRAFFWSTPSATPTFVPGLADVVAAVAAINENGQAAGTIGDHALLFDGTAARDLGALGDALTTEARDVNSSGIVVGAAWTSTPETGFVFGYAFVSNTDGSLERLPDLGGRAGAFAINDAGVIVGFSLNTAGESRAIRWTRAGDGQPYVAEDLGLSHATARDINNVGEIAGSFRTRNQVGFYWRNGVVKALPVLSYAAGAVAINEQAHITGFSYFRNTYEHAVLWTNVRTP